MQAGLPVLYSFRRCPYAMRARMAVRYSGLSVELREVVLKDMPASLLACSPKGTVPVLVLPDGAVIDESRDIMAWALAQNDPDGWLPASTAAAVLVNALLDENDTDFKAELDRYKYAVRYPEHPAEHYRDRGARFLAKLEDRLGRGDYLLGERLSLADVGVFPFVRQFAHVDTAWFDAAPFPQVQRWLAALLGTDLFSGVMGKYPQWHAGDAVTVFP
ncbi:MAG: glutathione S-transferase [Gammaproteobacteria bacterium]|nr:glutathione S-transferase [Gammaproteobacteria bacterium]